MRIGKWIIAIKDFVWLSICMVIVICFLIGLYVYDSENASDILSGASTAVSIVLSIVAILYTMIEGANSTQVNQETKIQLSNIDKQLTNVTNKMAELKVIDQRIRDVVPHLEMAVQELEKVSDNGSNIINDNVKQNVEYIMKYIQEDDDEY